MEAGIIPLRGDAPHRSLPTYPPESGDAVTRELWNLQVAFDERIHAERALLMPCDVDDPDARDAVTLHWVWGECFAILQELDELREAIGAGNADEETVDVLHFTMSLGNKLGLEPEELGIFSDVFEQALQRSLTFDDFEGAFRALLPELVQALNEMVGNSFKWWKNHGAPVDWTPFVAGLRKVHFLNLVLAGTVFPTWQAMYERYTGKVAENHRRQGGDVAGREDYRAV